MMGGLVHRIVPRTMIRYFLAVAVILPSVSLSYDRCDGPLVQAGPILNE